MAEFTLKYTDFKSIVNSKGLLWQYTPFPNVSSPISYLIYAVDGPLTYYTTLWFSGSEPLGADTVAMAANKTDFETNYQPTSNKNISENQQSVVQVIKPSIGSRAWTFSHNFCDKTTWFGDSIRVVDEAVGTGDGSTVTFNLDNTYVIDITHGKITDENYILPSVDQGGTTFVPEIKVNNVVKTERTFGEISGGNYTIDYAAGTITFFVAPANTLAITATYYYSPTDAGSTVYVRPPSGKKTIITAVECMLSTDVILTNAIVYSLFTYNPYLGSPPAKFEYPGIRTYFKKVGDFISYTNGAYPPTPPFGGMTRGTLNDYVQFRFEYVVSISLNDAYGSEIRVWLDNHSAWTGEIAQITFYGYQL